MNRAGGGRGCYPSATAGGACTSTSGAGPSNRSTSTRAECAAVAWARRDVPRSWVSCWGCRRSANSASENGLTM